MRRLTLCRWAALLTAALALAPQAAFSQGTLGLSGSFDMDALEQYGGPAGTDLADVFDRGNAHWWSLTLNGVTYSHDHVYYEWYDEFGNLTGFNEQFITRVHATSFDFQFFGFDADVLNQVVSSQLTRGDLSGGAVLELTNSVSFDASYEWGYESYGEWRLALAPVDFPVTGVGFFTLNWGTDLFSADADGYPVVEPQRVISDHTVIRDRRPGNDGALISYSNAMDIGSAGPFPPRMNIGDASVVEGDRGTVSLKLTVTLSWTSDHAVTVNYATVDGTADKKSDYTATSGALTFPPGQTSRTISVAIKTDRKREQNETFSVKLSNAVGANIVDGLGTATILNDD